MASTSDTSGGSTSSSSEDTGCETKSSVADASSASSDDLESGSRESARSSHTGSGSSVSDGEKSRNRSQSGNTCARYGIDLVFVWLGVLLGGGALVFFGFVHHYRERSVSGRANCICLPSPPGFPPRCNHCIRCGPEEEFPVSLIVLASIAYFFLLAAGPTLIIMKIRGAHGGRAAGSLKGLGGLAGIALVLLTFFFMAAVNGISCDDPEGMSCLSSSQKEAFTNWCIKNKTDGAIGLGLMWASFVASCIGQVIFFYSKDVAAGDPEAPSERSTKRGTPPSETESFLSSDHESDESSTSVDSSRDSGRS
jgi:hypothetical protein